MNYLLDTEHWSFIQRLHPQVIARLESLPERATLYMSVVTQAELLVGVELAASESRRAELFELYQRVVEMATEILPITSDAAQCYARIFSDLKRKGKPIPINDIWIAAIALANECVLVSSDEHFRFIEGLKVEDWAKPQTEEGEDP